MSQVAAAESRRGGRDLEDDSHLSVIDLHATHEGQDEFALHRAIAANPAWSEADAILRSVPGVGPVLTLTLLAELSGLRQK